MKKWLRRIRGAIGMGLTWAGAWFGLGIVLQLGFLLVTGSRAEVPFHFLFGAFGLIAGVSFSAVLGAVEGRGRFDQMSIPRFAAWGGAGGLLFTALVALGGDPGFLASWPLFASILAVAGAGSAAGSLALARRVERRDLLASTDELADVGLSDEERRELLGGRG